ncbi:GerAB/ArcD/ProY family transporter [Peribacillus frigoritolerans]|uniref:GerAB/ArcD/ProY family transporter n=1 Tax=Peribacillus frigoritolerans TaxID=450367 RepID=UPI003F821589
MKNVKISPRQFGIIVIFYSIGTAILITPSELAAIAKQDAWIAAILGSGLALLLVVLYTALGNRFFDKTFVEVNEILLGKWIGKLISLTFVFFSLIGAAILVIIVGNFVTTQIMPDTPIVAIHIIFVTIVVMGVRLGIETLARAAEILFPLFVLLFIIFAVFISPQIEFQNLQPVLETGIKPIIHATISLTSIISLSPIILLMIFPVSVNQSKQAQKAFFIGTFIGGIFLIITIALTILVLGFDETARHIYPSYALARKINVGNFLQRIEAIMAIMWFITIYFRLVMYFYVTVLGLSQILNLKDYRPLTLPLGMILIVLSLIIYPNIIYAGTWTQETWLPYALTYGLFLPVLLLVVAKLRKKS